MTISEDQVIAWEVLLEGYEQELGRRCNVEDDAEALLEACLEDEDLAPLFLGLGEPDRSLRLVELLDASIKHCRREMIRLQHMCGQKFGIEP